MRRTVLLVCWDVGLWASLGRLISTVFEEWFPPQSSVYSRPSARNPPLSTGATKVPAPVGERFGPNVSPGRFELDDRCRIISIRHMFPDHWSLANSPNVSLTHALIHSLMDSHVFICPFTKSNMHFLSFWLFGCRRC